jgi:type IV pilus assembly protein PilE
MNRNRGWTLVELMITIMVLAVLMAIAYPAYNGQITKARRADGKAMLYSAAQRQQQFYTSNNAFTSTVGSGGLQMDTTSQEGFYTLSIATTGTPATTYTLTANPVAPQTADTDCARLTLTHLGQKGISGTSTVAKCW